MSFVVIIIALFLERFAPMFSRLKRYGWFDRYMAMVGKQVASNAWLNLAAVVAPLLVGVGLVHVFLSSFMYGLLAWAFDLLIVFYCLGDSKLKEHVDDYLSLIEADEKADASLAFNRYFSEEEPEKPSTQTMVSLILRESHRRIFGLIFWYSVLGIIGAVLYRVISLTVDRVVSEETAADNSPADYVLSVLNWVPARLTAFCFCLVGHFTVVFPVWCQYARTGLDQVQTVLYQCAYGALGLESAALDQLATKEQLDASFGLVNRALVVWLVVVALILLF